MNKGLKIITLDATDLFQYDTKTKQVVSSNLTQFYQMKDENGELLKDEEDNVLQFYKRNLFSEKLLISHRFLTVNFGTRRTKTNLMRNTLRDYTKTFAS